MKYLLTFFVIVSLSTGFSGSFFDLSFTGLDGSSVPTSTFKGKRVIVVAFNGARPDRQMLHTLDSIQVAGGDSLQVIAFPALDFDSSASSAALRQLGDSMDLRLTIAQPCRVTKAAGTAQVPLFQWLTSVQGNGHFGRDVEEEGMLFVVNRNGDLYSIINRGLYDAVLPQALTNPGN